MRIREGDPLEIYTDREGEVIFKKYSPIGELASFAAQYAETLQKTCSMAVVITDRDAVVASAGVPKKEYSDRKISADLEDVVESRSLYLYREGGEKMPVIEDSRSFFVSCAMPIIAEGDVVGCVAAVLPAEMNGTPPIAPDLEVKLIQTAAHFLGKQLEG